MRERVSAAVAFAAVSMLALSSCGALVGLGGTSGPGASSSTTTASGEDVTASDLEGRVSDKVGTEGMAPIGDIAEIEDSAALGIDADPATDPAWGAFYSQDLTWGECEDPAYSKAQCATIQVPLKWNEPDAETLDLLVTKLPATGEAKGSLVVNPGGPGGSGAQLAAEYAPLMFTQDLLANYDIIGFDPRGVKDSSGIECLSDEETDEYLSLDASTETPEGIAEWEEWGEKIAESCETNSGDILPYLDTYSAARDMDVIRALVGSEKLDYLGYSYGTYLGATYAELYPERTGRFVLDSAVDPELTADELSAGQAQGFEQAILNFATWCLNERSTCPLTGTPEEGVQQISDFLDQVEEQPITTTSGRELTGGLALTSVIVPMYGDENWDLLATGLEMAFEGNGDLLLMLADFANERESDGTFDSNGMYAIMAVNCLDHPGVIDEDWVEAESERLAEQYPTFGSTMGGSGVLCEEWPAPAVRAPAPVNYTGDSTIVVIGVTNDPATPYPWSEDMRDQLGNAVLLTYEGEGHTAYGRSGGCIEDMVDAYFIDGTVPEDGATCPAS